MKDVRINNTYVSNSGSFLLFLLCVCVSTEANEKPEGRKLHLINTLISAFSPSFTQFLFFFRQFSCSSILLRAAARGFCLLCRTHIQKGQRLSKLALFISHNGAKAAGSNRLSLPSPSLSVCGMYTVHIGYVQFINVHSWAKKGPCPGRLNTEFLVFKAMLLPKLQRQP